MRCVRTVSVRGSGSWRQFPVYFAILRNSFVQVINYAFFLFVSGKLSLLAVELAFLCTSGDKQW
jgi:hypothetical protein